MIKKHSLIILAALATCLFLSCASNATASNEEATAVIAMAGGQLGPSVNERAISIKTLGDSGARAALYSSSIDGPKGGSAIFSYTLGALSPLTCSGSITYNDFAIEYEGSIYILNGNYNLDMTYAVSGSSVSLTHSSSGNITIIKDGGPAKDFTIDTTSTSTASYVTADGATTIALHTVVTGTVNGESVNFTEDIVYSV
ncbi:MAG TPA: hypothetical protein VN445_02835 [Rectinemataceae bacterium]|nr:hypothetical protein [Rectinemataceae bacterium]